jgi:hypothetical protein
MAALCASSSRSERILGRACSLYSQKSVRSAWIASSSSKTSPLRWPVSETNCAPLLEGLRKDGKKIAAYGAAAKGATLLNYCEIDEQWLDFAVDRNVHKQGKYMPGTRLEIRAPEALLDAQPDYCLILPWNFRDEIVAQQREYTQRGGRFIVPVPRPQVLEQAPDRAAERPRES